MPLDERALRREGFSEGPRVKLGDGQEWTFPEPYLRFAPRLNGDGRPVMDGGLTYGDDYADRLDDWIAAEDTYQRLSIQMELAAGLLLRNYALDDRALRRLLSLEVKDGASSEMWEEINLVLKGLSAPKASAVGSDSASEPTASTPIESP